MGSCQVEHANGAFEALVGRSGKGGGAHEWLNFDPEDKRWTSALDTLVVLGHAATCQLKAYRKNPGLGDATESFQADLRLVLAGVDANDETLALLTVLDTTDTHNAAQLLDQERQRTRALSAELEEGVLVVDSAMLVSQMNPAAASMLGMAADEATGRHVNDVLSLVDAQTGQTFNNPMVTAVLVGIDAGWTEGVQVLRPDGSRLAVRFCTKVVRDDEGMPVEAVLILCDQGQEAAVLASLTHQAGHDVLTGLVLRSVFDERHAQALALSERHNRRSAVMLIHIQQLEDARLQLGHAATDEQLRLVADHLIRVFRRSDTVCRFDEQHFGVVLTQLDDVIDAHTLLGKLTAIVPHAPLALQAAIAIYPKDGLSADSLLAHCSAAISPRTGPQV